MKTRMHSSRMRSARSLTVSRSIWVGGACHACPAATHTPLPCMPPATHAPHHACPPPHAPPTMHPPCHANRMTDRCLWKYYLAATSLRAVMKTRMHSSKMRTARLSIISRSIPYPMYPRGGGGCTHPSPVDRQIPVKTFAGGKYRAFFVKIAKVLGSFC